MPIFRFIFLFFISMPILAGEGLDLLQQFHRDVKTFKAEFDQTVRANQFKPVQQSSGSVLLKRPDQFRWEYKEPFPQTIVSDGKTIWLYDRELEQVTIKKVSDSLGNAPSRVLSGKRPLEQDFTITELNRGDEYVWVELTPKQEDTDFQVIRVAFENRKLAQLELEDNLGQLTTIRFRNMQINPELDMKNFKFTIPPNVDVVGEAIQ